MWSRRIRCWRLRDGWKATNRGASRTIVSMLFVSGISGISAPTGDAESSLVLGSGFQAPMIASRQSVQTSVAVFKHKAGYWRSRSSRPFMQVRTP